MGEERLVEGEDYYLEEGLLVFTAEYHQKRGYCCGNACRHCPYGNAPADRQRAEAAAKVRANE